METQAVFKAETCMYPSSLECKFMKAGTVSSLFPTMPYNQSLVPDT